MLDFDLGFDPVVPTPSRTQVALQEAPSAPTTTTVVQEMPVLPQPTVSLTPSQAAAYAMKPDEHWGWNDLRDFVIAEIEKRHGPQLRDPKKEAAIFKAFMTRWPDSLSIAIARSAFAVHDGMWRNAPVTVNRFCAASDPYFAAVIAQRL